MRYDKPALLYADQLTLLVRRGLACDNQPHALQWLKWIGYYRLSAYFIPFRLPGSETFRPGAGFNEVVDLYNFDCGLRLLVLEAMDRIEVSVRAAVTYRLGHDLGAFGYTDPTNFSPNYGHAELLKIVRLEEQRSSEVFVSHYRKKYLETHLPVWMATELIPFGALSKMYGNVRFNLRKQIAREFRQPEPVFTSWLHSLAAVRNICAHHSRLWNRELSIKPELPFAWKARGIDNGRFYVIALVIQDLLTVVSPGSTWKERLRTHLDKYPAVDHTQMRFPSDWRQRAP